MLLKLFHNALQRKLSKLYLNCQQVHIIMIRDKVNYAKIK